MSYSDMALAFSKIPVDHQMRAEDRVSFLYLEKCRVMQDDTGLVAETDGEILGLQQQAIEIPAAGICCLVLGPGTSITQPAITTCARSGCSVLFTGTEGLGLFAAATPLTSRGQWAYAQAALVSDRAASRQAARLLYSKQLGIAMDTGLTISQMRSIEGRMVRKAYATAAKKSQIKGFKRLVDGGDPVNETLNMLNGILYGCAATACAMLGLNPALGIIHRGDVRALLFDLADTEKILTSIPIAFEAASHEDYLAYGRRRLRQRLHERDSIAEMVRLLIEVLTPHLPEQLDDRLIGGRGQDVAGHKNY